MNKKIITTIVGISMVLSSLCSCASIKANISLTKKDSVKEETTQNGKNTPLPYYSVTNAYVNHEKNFCYELDIRIPVIEYSSEGSDTFIDSINKEIYDTILTLAGKSVDDANDNFKSFVESAKANIEADKENKINALKVKYKSVMGPDEVKAIANVLSKEVVLDEDIIASDSEVTGFTSSDGLIIPGLHNKRIIVVETTGKKEMEQTTVSIDGRPGRQGKIAPQEGFNGKTQESKQSFQEIKNEISEEVRKEIEEAEKKQSAENANVSTTITEATKDEIKETTETTKEVTKETTEITKEPSKEETSETKTLDKNNKGIRVVPPEMQEFKKHRFASMSEFAPRDFKMRPPRATQSEFVEITLENFYKELEYIKHKRVPSVRELAWQYIPTTICYDFDVMCLDNKYLSLVINITEDRINKKERRLYYNIDLEQKKLVTLKDLKGEDATGDDNAFVISNNHEPITFMDKFAITK